VHRSHLLRVVFFFALVFLVLSPSIVSTRAVTSYLPNVNPGQFAQYKVLKDSCHSSIPQICQQFGTSLNDTTYAAAQVVGKSGPAVTLQLLSIFKNGTGAHQGAIVNVDTGTSNVTAFSRSVSDYFLLAGNLQFPDQIWNTASAPSFNKTSSEIVLGKMRTVNFLNFSVSGSAYLTVYSGPAGFAFDQSSGFLIGFSLKLRTTGTSITDLDLSISMVDNNVWGNAHIPDFDLSANPINVNTAGSAAGNSTLTLQRLYGFSAIVKLSATASASGISCSFSANSLQNGGSDTSILSCRGSPGTYTVRVDGNGGYSMHNTSITVKVSTSPIQPASILSMPLVYGGIGVAAIVAALVAFLFLKRKPSGAIFAPGDASPGATQA
jgi:hypothetical protein